MTNRRIRHTRESLPSLPPDYYAQDVVSELEAGALWLKCIKKTQQSQRDGLAHFKPVELGHHGSADMHFIIDERGRLVRFWLRLMADNRLVIVGNRDGLLPLNVGVLHGR